MRLPPGVRRLFRLEGHGRGIARAVDDELRFHFDMTTRDLMARGLGENEARQEAERRFGDVRATRARLEAIDRGRDGQVRRSERWSAFVQDLRYTIRGIRARPGFAAVIVLTLALGIGANATMYDIIDRLLLRTPAYLIAPDRVHRVYLGRTFDGIERLTPNMGYKRYLELTQWSTSFDRTAAFFTIEMALGTGEETAIQPVEMVSASFWGFFDARPVIGRVFGPDEDKVPEGAPVAVLGHAYWQSKYGGRRDVLGKTIAVGRGTYTIIGVAPEGFAGMSPRNVAAFIPITLGVYDLFGGLNGTGRTQWYTTHNMSWMEMLARRKPGVSVEAAAADVSNAYRRSYLAQAGPGVAPIDKVRPSAVAASVIRERGPNQGSDSKVATWLLGVAAIVLLIACANVANLLLARAFRRRREIAVRVALGVSRGRLLAQLLTESIVLSLLGAAGGLLVTQWGGRVLRAAILPQAEWTGALANPRLLVFALVIGVLVGLVTGVVPALQIGAGDVSAALKAGAREGTYHRSRLRTTLLVLQASLSVVLLVGAGLFVRSLQNVRGLHLGYDPDHVLFVEIEMRGVQLDSARRVALRNDLLARARAVPGIEDAALTATVPFYMSWNEDLFSQSRDSVRAEAYFNAVSPTYFATLGTRLLRGRGFTESDRAGAPAVIVVSEAMARHVWPNEEALGKCLRRGADTAPCATVVGIAESIVRGSLSDDKGLQYYSPAAQALPGGGGLFVRARGSADELVETMRRELQRVMPGLSYVEVRSLESILGPNVRSWKLGATMFALFGALALLLAAVGLYSVIAYNVTQRSHELGVRIALGAQGRDLLRLVLTSGVRVAAVGVAIGGAIALAAGRFIAPLLYRVSPKDPFVYAAVIATLLVVAALASLLPALRATKVDPNVVLRAD